MFDFVIPVTPIGKPRMTQRDRWKGRPVVLRYHAYRDAVREVVGDAELPTRIALQFHIPMPKSWSKQKRETWAILGHQKKPDIDNLVKAFLDCWLDDSRVWEVHASKFWSDMDDEVGRIEVEEL